MSTPSTIETDGEVRFRPDIEPGPAGKQPKRRWWVWLLVLVVVALGVYRVRQGIVAPQAATGNAQAGAQARGAGTVPVVAAKATKGEIGVYFSGLGAVTPIYTVTIKSQIAGYLMRGPLQRGPDCPQRRLTGAN